MPNRFEITIDGDGQSDWNEIGEDGEYHLLLQGTPDGATVAVEIAAGASPTTGVSTDQDGSALFSAADTTQTGVLTLSAATKLRTSTTGAGGSTNLTLRVRHME